MSDTLDHLALPDERMGVSLEMVRRVLASTGAGAHPDDDMLIVALNYRCNSRCRFCIIEAEIDQRLEDTDREVFRAVYRANGLARARGRGFRRLTISGAESTLIPDLPALVAEAVEVGRFDLVRLQTNGRRLSDPGLARALVQAGAREYFVSMHAPTAALDARITRAPRSFDEMLRGVANLAALGARVLANTVVCAENAGALPDLARMQRSLGMREVHLWSFLHVGEAGQQDQLVPLHESLPPLLQALDLLEEGQVPATVKWFPRCLLGRHAARLDNHQPQMLIRDEFQVRLSDGFRFGCVNAADCRWYGRGCDGLHEGYRAAYGDEATTLRPEPTP